MFTIAEIKSLHFWSIPQVYGDPVDFEMYSMIRRALADGDETKLHSLLEKKLPEDEFELWLRFS
jgi:hypothetical protein